MVRSFWATQWPGGAERERDASIKAVLNKLGAFVTYDSIRVVIGQGMSTIRPRDIMDRGEVLLVDLSGVGGDNADALRRDARQPLLRRRGRPAGDGPARLAASTCWSSTRRSGSGRGRSRTARSRAASSAWRWRSRRSRSAGWGSG